MRKKKNPRTFWHLVHKRKKRKRKKENAPSQSNNGLGSPESAYLFTWFYGADSVEPNGRGRVNHTCVVPFGKILRCHSQKKNVCECVPNYNKIYYSGKIQQSVQNHRATAQRPGSEKLQVPWSEKTINERPVHRNVSENI